MAWGKLGSTTASGTTDEVSSGTITANNIINNIYHVIKTGTANTRRRFNNDTGANYASRSHVLNNEGTQINQTSIFTHADTSGNGFGISYILNISGEEKLMIGQEVSNDSNGAGNSPKTYEGVAKWTDTSAQITEVDLLNTDSGGFLTGSNLTVLGSDMTPATAITFPTNVQIGSRAEITDSRKMYNYAESGATDIQDKTLVQNGDDITYSGGVIDVNIGSSSSSEGDYLLHTLDVPITTTDFVLDFDYKRVSGGTGVFGGLVFRSNQSGESIENSNTGDYIRTSPNAAGTSMNMYWHNDGDSTETELGYLTGLNSATNWNYLRLTRTNGTTIKLERFSSEARSGSADATVTATNLSATWGLSLKYIGGYCAFASGGGLEEHFDNIDLSSTTKLWQEIGT